MNRSSSNSSRPEAKKPTSMTLFLTCWTRLTAKMRSSSSIGRPRRPSLKVSLILTYCNHRSSLQRVKIHRWAPPTADPIRCPASFLPCSTLRRLTGSNSIHHPDLLIVVVFTAALDSPDRLEAIRHAGERGQEEKAKKKHRKKNIWCLFHHLLLPIFTVCLFFF